MENQRHFVDGLIFKKPHENAPEFVKGKLSIKVAEFKKYLDENQINNWCNIDLKESQSGKYYAELDTWQPTEGTAQHPQYDPAPSKEAQLDIDTQNIPF